MQYTKDTYLHGEVLWGMLWWDLYACGSDQAFVHDQSERKSCTGEFGKCSVELLHYLQVETEMRQLIQASRQPEVYSHICLAVAFWN